MQKIKAPFLSTYLPLQYSCLVLEIYTTNQLKNTFRILYFYKANKSLSGKTSNAVRGKERQGLPELVFQ